MLHLKFHQRREVSHTSRNIHTICAFSCIVHGLAPVDFTFAVMSHWHFDNHIVVPARSFLAPSTRPQMLWRYILFHISRRVTGGMLVICALCHFPHPDKPGFIDFTNRPVSNTINGIWKKMADQGLITQVSCKLTLKPENSSDANFVTTGGIKGYHNDNTIDTMATIGFEYMAIFSIYMLFSYYPKTFKVHI